MATGLTAALRGSGRDLAHQRNYRGRTKQQTSLRRSAACQARQCQTEGAACTEAPVRYREQAKRQNGLRMRLLLLWLCASIIPLLLAASHPLRFHPPRHVLDTTHKHAGEFVLRFRDRSRRA